MPDKSRMKIAMVAPANNPHTERFAEHFIKCGHELKIISYAAGDIDNAEIYVHSRIPEDIKGLKRKWEYFKDYREVRSRLEWADIVFVNFIYNWRFNEVYRGLDNVVVLLWGSDITWQKVETAQQIKYKKLILKIANRVLAFSDFLSKAAIKYMPDETVPEVLPVGINTEIFHPGNRTLGPTDPVVIGYAKGLYSKYGPDILIKACDILRNEDMNFICRIAGSGDMNVDLKVMVDRLDLKNYVEFLGRLHHDVIPDFMRNIDIFVMPSIVEESFGVAALEASATGIPVIASNTGGIPEAIWHDETGLLVEPGNHEELASTIRKLIMTPDVRYCMGSQGRAFVKTNFKWEKTTEMLDKVFQEVYDATGLLD